ncbi:hypothetical protein ABZ611_14960 [Streptomyces sp. NPDC007861]
MRTPRCAGRGAASAVVAAGTVAGLLSATGGQLRPEYAYDLAAG